MKADKLNSSAPMLLFSIIIAFSSISGVFRLPSVIYVLMVFLFFLFFVVTNLDKVKIGYTGLLIFVLICFISILINRPASYFRVWERLAVFVLTLLAFSPIIVGGKINEKRYQLFETFIFILICFSAASFFAYFFGINYFVRNDIELDYTEAGHFSGFTNHSMKLAPISAISCIYSFASILKYKDDKKKRVKWILLFVFCAGSLLLSASRGALGGSILGILAMLVRYSSGKLSKTFKYIVITLLLATVSFPFWRGFTSSIIAKNAYNESQGGVMYSRGSKMAARIYEIQNNFFTGVGFSTVDESVDGVDREKGTIEPNSSWLGVFSMTGVFGFVVFLGLFIKSARDAYKKIPDKIASTMMCGLMAFFFVHLIIEGYVLAGGNALCGMFWLTMGAIYAQMKPRLIRN